MKHLDLFSGIGGFALAASWVWGDEHEIVSFCEIDPFCQKVLKKHWPDVPIVPDIRNIKGEELGTVDLITGGFPCQPFSYAGKRRGKEDDRFLWPEMLRIIQETQTKFVIGENVPNIENIDNGMVVEQIISDLENIGYEVLPPFEIPACAVNACHRRGRYWFLAYAKTFRLQKHIRKQKISRTPNCEKSRHNIIFSHSGWAQWKGSPWGNRRNNDVPDWVDRIKALGNAIVPQVVVPIMEAIKEIGI